MNPRTTFTGPTSACDGAFRALPGRGERTGRGNVAIVFQGLQKEFCDPAGLLHDAVREQLARRRSVPNLLACLQEALTLGVRAYFVPIAFSPDYRELRNPEGILGLIRDRGAFKCGGSGVEPIEALAPFLPSIRTLEPKRGICAFGTTHLAEELARDGIETVAVAGLLTNVCVESTARTAYDLGYKVVVLSDCTAARSAGEQEASEKFIFPLLGQTKTYREFLHQLRAEPPAARVAARLPGPAARG